MGNYEQLVVMIEGLPELRVEVEPHEIASLIELDGGGFDIFREVGAAHLPHLVENGVVFFQTGADLEPLVPADATDACCGRRLHLWVSGQLARHFRQRGQERHQVAVAVLKFLRQSDLFPSQVVYARQFFVLSVHCFPLLPYDDTTIDCGCKVNEAAKLPPRLSLMLFGSRSQHRGGQAAFLEVREQVFEPSGVVPKRFRMPVQSRPVLR